MSWLYSQELVEAYLGENFSDGEQSVPLNGKPIQQAYCAPDKMTEFSRLSRFGMTFKPLMEDRGEELLTLYLEDFRAKTSQLQEEETDLMENDQECGERWHGLLGRYDLDSHLWRTVQCSLLEDLNDALQTLPRWGMTVGGELYLRPISEAPFPLGGKQRSRTFFSCSLTTVDQVCVLQDQSSWMTILSVEDWSCTLISGGLGVVWEDVKTVFLPTTVENCCCSNSQNPTGDLYQLLCEPLCYILKSQMAGYWTFLLYLLRSPTKIQRLLCIENLKILSRSGRYCRNSSIIPGTAAVRYSE